MKYLIKTLKKIKLNNKVINFIDVPIKNKKTQKNILKIVSIFL